MAMHKRRDVVGACFKKILFRHGVKTARPCELTRLKKSCCFSGCYYARWTREQSAERDKNKKSCWWNNESHHIAYSLSGGSQTGSAVRPIGCCPIVATGWNDNLPALVNYAIYNTYNYSRAARRPEIWWCLFIIYKYISTIGAMRVRCCGSSLGNFHLTLIDRTLDWISLVRTSVSDTTDTHRQMKSIIILMKTAARGKFNNKRLADVYVLLLPSAAGNYMFRNKYFRVNLIQRSETIPIKIAVLLLGILLLCVFGRKFFIAPASFSFLACTCCTIIPQSHLLVWHLMNLSVPTGSNR